ncbi:MAG: glycosyltransferase family 2 protein [Verrucomicrobia bacterium]|nr:glycosyltransferase family 2 protein [Verrucomicrobiota bacterium]
MTSPTSPTEDSADNLEVTVVIPCLNEEKTVGGCVASAIATMRAAGLAGEVVVADNGSRDASCERATAAGARIVNVARRGYGSALMAGIAAARGRFVIMGDADASYDFSDVPRFVVKLREGFDLVQGCRLPRGGGTVAPGAMPWSHRWIGNPALSLLARLFFRTGLNDIYCGLRGFTRDFAARMDQRCTGMEFATEMIIKAALHRVRLAEIPITLHRDGRDGAGSHLRTFHDGWRTLRLFLLYSPRWLHLFPSAALLAFGLVAGLLAWFGVKLGPATLGPHTLLVAVVLILLGYQGLMLALFARTFAWRENLAPASPFLEKFYRVFTLERALLLSLVATIAGGLLIGHVFWTWRGLHYGELPYAITLRRVVPGLLLTALAAQTFFGSFVISLTSLERK